MRVGCVLATHLRAKVEMHRHQHLKDHPVLIVGGDPTQTNTLVVDHFPAAVGVREGMPLQEALSQHASAVVLDADEPRYRRSFRRIVSDLQGVGQSVEPADLGTAYVRLDGLEGLYGGEKGTISAVMSALPPFLGTRVGVADAKFPAYVAARTQRGPGASGITKNTDAFLAPHSIDLLPISPTMKVSLHRFGLHTMGSVASISGHMLTDRFGREGLRAWSLCNGVDDSPIVPQSHEEPLVERISLALHPSFEALLMAVNTALLRAFARPELKGRLAGSAHLLGEAEGWPAWESVVRFKQPVKAWQQAAIIVRGKLEAEPPRRPIEDLTLTLSDFSAEAGTQLSLLRDTKGERIGRLVDTDRQLRPFMKGHHALYRIAGVAPWHPVPEMRYLQVPIDPSAKDTIRPLLTPRPVDVRADAEGEPEALRVGGCWQTIAHIDDRWTFDLWWLPKPLARSYYRVDPGDGQLMTLFWDHIGARWYRQNS